GLRKRKDAAAFIGAIARSVDRIIAVPLSEDHIAPQQIASLAHQLDKHASTAPSLADAMQNAAQLPAPRVLICGSFLLAAEALAAESASTLSFSHSTIFDFSIAPTFVEATFPSLNTISVGMPRTPYLPGVIGLSSMLSFTTCTRSPISLAISSSAGPICLHGPHHSAQKSTSTGRPDFSTSASKLSSETLVVATGFAPSEP